ncbi:MAG: PA domain-containing protein [Bacteroidota bacterium]
MKKLLLSIALVSGAFWSTAQVITAIQFPPSIMGNKEFTWADPSGGDWASTDFLVPGVYIEDTLILVNDGTPGNNATYGNLLAEEGCFASPAGAYAGKIAVLRRNTCEFGKKAFEAQQAGAIGVIIINRDPEVIEMGGGVDGINVTIPVVMINSNDGAAILAEMLNGPVVALIGNKTGLYANDAGITKSSTLISKSAGVTSQLSMNAAEFSFDMGTHLYNYGSNDQANIMVTAMVDGPSGNVYSETVGPISLNGGDSVEIIPAGAFEFPTFSLASYPAGEYTVSYEVDLGVADEYDADNAVVSTFNVQDSIFSLARLDPATGLTIADNGYRPSGSTGYFTQCINMRDANASRIGVEGLYFSALATGVDLSGEEMVLSLYRWDDAFADLSVTPTFDALTEVANGFYYFPSDLQGETVYGEFTTPVLLTDNDRYLACVQTFNTELFLGFDTKTDYIWNEAYYLQPLTIIDDNGTYYASGFGADVVPAIGAKIFNAAELGINEEPSIEGSAYPNPAVDVVTIAINAKGTATLNVTDLAGRTVKSMTVTMNEGKSTVNVADLTSGAYIFNVVFEDGKSSQFNVIKK